jgi:tRNA dimethylallyltransferase
LAGVDPEAAARIHPNDERRIVRALEVYHATGTPITALQRQWDSGQRRYEAVFIGLRRDKADQGRRINLRAKMMLDAGLADEVAALLAEPGGLSGQAAQAVGYAELIDYIKGLCSLDEAFEQIKINTRRLAKKQRTWHRRFAGVTWFDAAPDETPEALAARVIEAIME